MDERRKIEIILSGNVRGDMLVYIADCWAEFVTQDLGLEPKDAMMVLPNVVDW